MPAHRCGSRRRCRGVPAGRSCGTSDAAGAAASRSSHRARLRACRTTALRLRIRIGSNPDTARTGICSHFLIRRRPRLCRRMRRFTAFSWSRRWRQSERTTASASGGRASSVASGVIGRRVRSDALPIGRRAGASSAARWRRCPQARRVRRLSTVQDGVSTVVDERGVFAFGHGRPAHRNRIDRGRMPTSCC